LFRSFALTLLLLAMHSASTLALADEVLFPEPEACKAPEEPLALREEDERGPGAWTDCEKWVWSCIRQGKEANLFAKECTVPRSPRFDALRMKLRFAPFVDPERYAAANALSDEFIRTILWAPEYRAQIPPQGVRIFGAYFADAVNLENVSTQDNLVLDATMARDGIRLSNFDGAKNLSLDHSNIRGALILLRLRISGSLFLDQGVYDLVDLRDAKIGASIDAERSVFNSGIRLDRAHIDAKVNLKKSRLTELTAWDAFIGGSLNLRLADVRLRIDLSGSVVEGDTRLQNLTFGQRTGPDPLKCDWDPALEGNHVLNELSVVLKDRPPPHTFDRAWQEIVATRPGPITNPAKNPCEPPEQTEPVPTEAQAKPDWYLRHEVLLRDMRIKGTLCLIDLTGEIGPKGGAAGSNLKTISLDGTQASSTVLRWQKSESRTLWRAVNFKTGYLLLNLDEQPKAHFIDNVDFGFIALVRQGPEGSEVASDEEDLSKWQCDETPQPTTRVNADTRDAQDKLIKFFTGEANQSGSAQPFANVVARLEASGTSATALKMALSEYRLRNLCSTSAFVKTWQQVPQWRTTLQKLRQTWTQTNPTRMGWQDGLNESRKLFLDGLCYGGLLTYKYSVSYGHEPHNLFILAIGAIGFFWILLKFDKVSYDAGGKPQRLGLIYAIDTFIPMAQYRMHRRYANILPSRSVLRWYLTVHRFVGFVLVVAIFVLVVSAGR
jgi:hypothetical protein